MTPCLAYARPIDVSEQSTAGEGSGLLTADEVAAILRVHPSTVLRWAKEGGIAAVRLPGRAVRFRRSDIEKVLNTSAAVTPAEVA